MKINLKRKEQDKNFWLLKLISKYQFYIVP